MHEEPTTVIIQRSLDALPGGTAAEPLVREPLERAAGRLRLLSGTFLYKSYPRLTRPPVNLETDELLGGVVAGLIKALQTARPPTALRFFARRADVLATTQLPASDPDWATNHPRTRPASLRPRRGRRRTTG
jgi:hypothetical protein